MAERVTSIQDAQREASETINQVKSDVDELLNEIDVDRITSRVEEFGKQNPLMLAAGALTIGLAAGLLMTRNRRY